MDGWAKLGAALGGAGGGQDAFMRGQEQAYDLETKLARARMATQEEVARTSFAKSLAGMGIDPAQAQHLGSLMQGGQNINQVFGALQTQQGMGMQSELWNRINGGQAPAEWGGLNQALAVLDGKPVQVTGESGGTLYNRLVAPGAQAPVTTDVGMSTIAQRMAAAENSKASALRNAALAATQASVQDRNAAQAEYSRARAAGVQQDAQDAPSAPFDGRLEPQAGVPERVNLDAPAKPAPMLPKGQYTEKDAADMIAAAERAIAAGKDRNAIEKMLRENLAQMGFSYGE